MNTTTFDVLSHKDKPVRIALLDGIPHFSLEDICAAVGWPASAYHEIRNPLFIKGGAVELDQLDGTTAHYLTPVAVWHFTNLVCAREGQNIAAWTKRESLAWCPEIPRSDPRFFLTLTEDYRLPWRPCKYSGRLSEYYALQDTPEYQNRFELRQKAVRSLPEHQAAEKARLEMLAEIAAANAGGAR